VDRYVTRTPDSVSPCVAHSSAARWVQMPMLTAAVIGSGPKGLSAAMVLAAAGIATLYLNVMFKLGRVL
jgi:ribulose 1,5-bisphosphate synthetase/thiazole synthase